MRAQAGHTTDVERVREKFLTAGSVDAVRPVDEDILQPSIWTRGVGPRSCMFTPTGSNCPTCENPIGVLGLARAAAPVLQRVTDDLASHAVSVVLTSTDGVVVERNAAEVSILNALNTISLAPGYSLAEEVAGTNGIGTALETGRPAFVRGGEHYVGMFTGFACAGSPIRDPITSRVIGAVNLSCLADESDPLLFALAASASRHIEDRMRAVAHEGETALLEAYLQRARRSSGGVLGIGGDVVLMNPYLRRTLDGTEQTALLEHASDLLNCTLCPVRRWLFCRADASPNSPPSNGRRCVAAASTLFSALTFPPRRARIRIRSATRHTLTYLAWQVATAPGCAAASRCDNAATTEIG